MRGDARLPARLEVQALCRAVQHAGGFATVLAKGEADAGTLLVICCDRNTPAAAWERMPAAQGGRHWALVRQQDADRPEEFAAWWQKRRAQDGDLWVLELDIADAQGFLAGAKKAVDSGPQAARGPRTQ